MILFNQSKRLIGGIAPLTSLDVEEKEAEKLLRMYKGEIFASKPSKADQKKIGKLEGTISELKKENEALKKIVASQAESVPESLDDETDEDEEIEELRRLYLDKFEKEVPVNKKNDRDWLSSKLEA